MDKTCKVVMFVISTLYMCEIRLKSAFYLVSLDLSLIFHYLKIEGLKDTFFVWPPMVIFVTNSFHTRSLSIPIFWRG